jgi:quercetin dioxygenase-like cupin family protein
MQTTQIQTTPVISSRRTRGMLAALICTVSVLLSCERAFAQVPCLPVSERTSEVGCWVVADETIGRLPEGPIFWHLDTYMTLAAAEAAKGPRGSVVESFGKIWLLTIAELNWRPSNGVRVAEIGPLPVSRDAKYTAQYMEAVFTPGMTSPTHRHPGPEAWYTLTGETCLETPTGKVIGRAGSEHIIIPGGPPMHLTATGTETRRALVLILHDSTQPPVILASDWTPKGLCTK